MDENTHTATPKPSRDDTVTFKRSHLYALLVPVAFVLGLSVGYLFWGRTTGTIPPVAAAAENSSGATAASSTSDPQAAAAVTQTPNIRRYDVPLDDDPSIGPEDAPLTLIEFSDFECPYCKQWYSDVYHQLSEAYPDQLRIVYRDFPLPNHPNAVPAAEAANCAQEQGKFWEFHDRLFEADGLSQAVYETVAADLGLDAEKFKECVETRRYKDEVQADFNYAADLGVNSTPTFFLNGIPLVGAQPLALFQEVIRRELAGEIPK